MTHEPLTWGDGTPFYLVSHRVQDRLFDVQVCIRCGHAYMASREGAPFPQTCSGSLRATETGIPDPTGGQAGNDALRAAPGRSGGTEGAG